MRILLSLFYGQIQLTTSVRRKNLKKSIYILYIYNILSVTYLRSYKSFTFNNADRDGGRITFLGVNFWPPTCQVCINGACLVLALVNPNISRRGGVHYFLVAFTIRAIFSCENDVIFSWRLAVCVGRVVDRKKMKGEYTKPVSSQTTHSTSYLI